MIVAYGYLMEAFMAWYGAQSLREIRPAQEPAVRPLCAHLLDDDDVQRVHPAASLVAAGRGGTSGCLWVISIVVNIGMWLERYVIVVTSLHRDYPAVVVGHVSRDVLGLRDVLRHARPVPLA